jgi:hypothetical protein
LLVTPAQAQIVTLASQLGQIRLILRSGEDSEQPKSIVMTAHELLGAYGGGNRATENPTASGEKRFLDWAEQMRKMMREDAKAAPAKTRAADAPQRCFTMRVRAGTEVNDVLLINTSSIQGLPGDDGAWTATGMAPSSHGKATGDPRGSKPVEIGPATLPAGPAKPDSDTVPPPSKPAASRPANS